jgi:hypothetical protein
MGWSGRALSWRPLLADVRGAVSASVDLQVEKSRPQKMREAGLAADARYPRCVSHLARER